MSLVRIGITGGIGSGKSYVAQCLKEHFHIPVYDCDQEAKRLNVESAEIRQALIRLAGSDVYAPDGNLRKDVLARFLFANEDNARRVNAIVHPVVARDFEAWADAQQQEELVAIESAILFESGFDKLVNVIINVNAPAQLRIDRATRRDNTTPQAIQARMDRQLSDNERQQRADYTIINDGRDLITPISNILREITTNNLNK